MTVNLNLLATLALATALFFVGQLIVARSALLQRYSIPVPVVGGFLFAVALALAGLVTPVQFTMNESLKDPLLLAFFATVAAANAMLVHYAVTTFGGVETDNAYAAGLKFQQDIQAAAAQEAAGWRVATELGRLDGAETEIRLHPVDSRGMALGGGCEFQMHAARTVFALESYIGLVEAGVGLLPAGGQGPP